MRKIEPGVDEPREVFKFLLGGIAPRPIALVSTISKDGRNNLAPFSFFNGFGSNPPMIGFSASRRGTDGSFKDTYNNLMATKECVVQAVTYPIFQQVNVASCEYEPGIDEFEKSGLTPIDSEMVAPKRVKESPFHMECVLHKMINLGENKGSGNLAICEVKLFHVSEDIIENDTISPEKIDLVGRHGGITWVRASGDALIKVTRPVSPDIVGFEGLPDFIKHSHVLTANDAAKIGNLEHLPSVDEILEFADAHPPIESDEAAVQRVGRSDDHVEMFRRARSLLDSFHAKAGYWLERSVHLAISNDEIEFALKAALYTGYITSGEIQTARVEEN